MRESSRFSAGLLAACLIVSWPTAGRAVDPDFKLFADDFPLTPRTRLLVGVNVAGMALSDLVRDASSNGYPDMAAIEAGTFWDFSGLDGGDTVLQTAPVEAGWSCYIPEPGGIPDAPCGFEYSGNDFLFVQDNTVTGSRDALAIDFDDTGADPTFFLRAWSITEGGIDADSDGDVDDNGGDERELRLCLNPSGRPDVPFVVFSNTEMDPPNRRYLTAGDSWQSAEFDCEVFGTNVISATQGGECGASGTNVILASNDLDETLARFTGRATANGTLRLPSGHVLDAVLVESLASFDGLLDFCLFFDEDQQRIRQYQVMWFVPGYGPLVQIRSTGNQGPDLTTWTVSGTTVIGYGLLPPLSLQVDSVGATSITVSWDPGVITRFIDGYRVYWGPDPGADGPPPFDSGFLDAASGTSYTIEGLTPGTDYHVSVTSIRSYTDPLSGAETQYESIAMPQTIGSDEDGDGVRDHSYPPEVMATTTVGPTAELAVNRRIVLTGAGPVPLLSTIFAPACATPPFTLCEDEIRAGDLGSVVLSDEASPSGTNSVWFYEHSDAVTTMRVTRVGPDLAFSAN